MNYLSSKNFLSGLFLPLRDLAHRGVWDDDVATFSSAALLALANKASVREGEGEGVD